MKIRNRCEELNDEYKLKIFMAYKDKLPVAGIIGSAIGNTGIYLLGASNEIGMKNKGSYLLQWRMIKWLKQILDEYPGSKTSFSGLNSTETSMKLKSSDKQFLHLATHGSYNYVQPLYSFLLFNPADQIA